MTKGRASHHHHPKSRGLSTSARYHGQAKSEVHATAERCEYIRSSINRTSAVILRLNFTANGLYLH
jgi:hypothetical protein